jgi:hypothetical protein
MIRCTKKGCLAGFSWLGDEPDKILAMLAQERGWRVYEANGWLCPSHAKEHIESVK